MYRPALGTTAAADGSLPVHAAAAFGSINIIKLFTYLNLDLNATTQDAVTPLMLAASAGHQKGAVIVMAIAGTRHQRRRAGQSGRGLINTTSPSPQASRLNWALFQLLSTIPAKARLAIARPQRRLRFSPNQPRASHQSKICPISLLDSSVPPMLTLESFKAQDLVYPSFNKSLITTMEVSLSHRKKEWELSLLLNFHSY
jgi:hypothetical protein